MIAKLLLSIVSGAAGWSFMEYALHCWGGHAARGRTFFSREHLAHHANPGYFTPTPLKLATAAPFLVVLAAVSVKLGGALQGLVFTTSFAASWALYELAHRRIHTHPPHSAWSRWRRLNHIHHHFREPRMNHGVTSPLWDVVFRTHVAVKEPIRVPRRLAMPWLLAPGTTELDPAYAADYTLAGRRDGGPASAAAKDAVPADLVAAYEGSAPQL
jgi:sterol desaturase/sphingolipid hydroxylase (fatty acid hydroxylase superfamily)